MDRGALAGGLEQSHAATRMALSDMLAAAQVLQRRCASERDEEYLEIIHRGVLRAVRNMEQEDLARRMEDEDELHARFASMDLVSWCRQRTDWAAPLLSRLGIELRFRADMPALITLGDEDLLERLLYALLSNAAKVMTAGGTLEVTLGARKGSAVLTVADEGPGFSEESLLRLFGPDDLPPDLTPQAGAGLGLTLARIIAEVHGGLLLLETAAGGGAQAAVSLPIREGVRERLESPRLEGDGAERALTALSDVLPLAAFRMEKAPG